MLDNARARAVVTHSIDPIVNGLVKFRISPDVVTCFGALGNCLVSYFLIAHGHFLIGAAILIVLSLTDLLDGALARRLGIAGQWGAFLDSTLDRVSDASVLIALIFHFSHIHGQRMTMLAGFLALVAGQLISYIRAKAESIGVECKVGIAERAERSIIVLTSLVLQGLGLNVFPYSMWLLALLSLITVAQRVHHVYVQTKQ